MDNSVAFKQYIEQGYTFKGNSLVLGTAMLNGVALPQTLVKVPLRSLNRHGLIAGATGTGKTKTLQRLAESLSDSGVPVVLMDIKGDLSGIAAPGESNAKIADRMKTIGIDWNPTAYTTEMLTLSQEKGTRLRATVSEFGPVLFSKILELNDTQAGVVAVVFKYADDQQLPLLDLKDFKKMLNFATNEGADEFAELYGKVASATASTILRKIVELEQQGADLFFGEPSFEVDDLCRLDADCKGIISIVRLTDLQDRPKLFSTFMLSLLAEVYASFPEEGDLDQPKLVFFIDEAHLLFDEASKALLDQIENIVRLIRSKGVGIFFCTQKPTDIPEQVLAQLGLKVQHALRAFTAKDRQDIKLTAQNYPDSPYYQTDELLTALGIGEAAVTVLDEKGRPTPLVATMMCAPQSRMSVLSDSELQQIVSKSAISNRYNREIDRESAYEILTQKLVERSQTEAAETEQDTTTKSKAKPAKEEPGMFEKLSKNTMVRQVGSSIAREVTRGLLGVLGLGGKSKKGWF
jgi:DNA helicase HerA-like ATPase